MRKKVLIRGPILSQSGYGEHARMILRALRTREDLFDIFIIPVGWGQTGWLSDYDEFREWVDQKIAITQMVLQQRIPFDVSFQVAIPNEWERLAAINIGVTAGIETTKVAPAWLQKANEMDKIIVPSTHAKWSYENTIYQGQDQFGNPAVLKLQTPIEVVPYPVREDIVAADRLPDLGLEKDDFAYLLVGQWGPRKNIENAIRWWVEENWDQDVSLIVKTSVRRNNIMDRDFTKNRIKALLDSIKLDKTEKKCKVHLLHGDMAESEMKALYQHPAVRCMITATHGEGFGLPLFEFAQTGKPIVATGWSAHLDFLTYKDEEGKTVNGFLEVDYDLAPIQQEAVWEGVLQADSMWAFPKEGSFKQRVRQARTKEKKWLDKSAKVAQRINNDFENDEIQNSVLEICYGSPIKPKINVDKKDIPKISLITSVFKAEEYIDQLMEDVTRQTIFEDKCEWVILNANKPGDDYEEQVIQRYIDKYPDNIVYKRLEEDGGIYDTWNKAIQMSTGEFITNINCDDRRVFDGLEKQAITLVANPDCSLVYNDSYVVDEPNVQHESITPQTKRYNFEQFSKEAMLRSNLPHNNPMWRKSVHEKHGYFDQKYKSAGDWDFWLRCAFGGENFIKHEDILGVYYFNPTGMSTNPEHDSWKKEHEKEIFLKYLSAYQDSMANTV